MYSMKFLQEFCVAYWVEPLRFWTLVCILCLLWLVPVQVCAVEGTIDVSAAVSESEQKSPQISAGVTSSDLPAEMQAQLRKPIDLSGLEKIAGTSDENELSIVQAMTQMFLGLLVVILMIVAAAWAYRRWGKQLAGHASSRQYMELLETMPVGVKRAVSLIRVGDQVLVVGQGEHEVNFLCSMKSSELQNAAQSEMQEVTLEELGSDSADNDSANSEQAGPVSAFKSKLEQMLRSKS